jgi:hypothetical protein
LKQSDPLKSKKARKKGRMAMTHKPERRAKKKLGSEERQCEKAADINSFGKSRRQKEEVYRNIKYI